MNHQKSLPSNTIKYNAVGLKVSPREIPDWLFLVSGEAPTANILGERCQKVFKTEGKKISMVISLFINLNIHFVI